VELKNIFKIGTEKTHLKTYYLLLHELNESEGFLFLFLFLFSKFCDIEELVNFSPKELAKLVKFTLVNTKIKRKILNFLGLKKKTKFVPKIQCNECVGGELKNIIALPWPPPVWGDSPGLNLLQTSQLPSSGVRTQAWELTQVPS
jgi:hypothetical protein